MGELRTAENHGIGSPFYPIVGLTALLLAVGTAIGFRFDAAARGSRSFPSYTAAVLAIAAEVVTQGILVPAMLSLRGRATMPSNWSGYS